LRILFTIAEAYPFVKVGGLADVGGALPKSLAASGHDVRLILPDYPSANRLGPGTAVCRLRVPMGPREERVEVAHHGSHRGVEVYTARNDHYFHEGMIYGGYAHGDVVPYILFSKAVAAFAALTSESTGWRPHVVHCNDWHTGLVPAYARAGPAREVLARTGFVFSIHNLAYQGRVGAEAEASTGPWAGLEADLEDTLLARGILSADVLNTVSSNYLKEILTPEHGVGMDGVLRSRQDSLFSVLNGVDYEEYDPLTDQHLTARYDAGSSAEGKRKNKAALQRRSGLAPDPDAPLLGVVARLVDEKGVDILLEALDALVQKGAQVVVAGLGAKLYRLALEGATRTMEGVAYHPDGREGVARWIYAGSDLFLAPSRHEPCGLAPLIALRYGTIPVVRKTGGLAETIPDYTEDRENGLGFAFTGAHPDALEGAVDRALEVRADEPAWRALQKRAMAARFSWEESVLAYEGLYRRAVASAGDHADAREGAGATPRATCRRAPKGSGTATTRTVPIALVHHANQYLITDGYEDRQGISQIVEGYARVLRMHERYAVPASLHLSGTLVEAAAWHCPWFLRLVRDLKESGVISPVGGTYSENVMPLFTADYNRRQLEEAFWLYEHHLGISPDELGVFWVPERVWDTVKLAPTLTDCTLPNGGYRHVLLDDRLLLRTNGHYPASPRARFDAAMPYRGGPGATDPSEAAKPYAVVGSGGLAVAPIGAELRYHIPPSSTEDLRRLERSVAALRGASGTVLVYADDLERTAGVGGWERETLRRYEVFLRWLSSREDVEAVHLPDWLGANPPREERQVEGGAFYELDRAWGAGEDYGGWWNDARYAFSKRHLREALKAAGEAEREGADGRLLELARKHLLASGYETAWHDPGPGDPVPAAWAKALASQARASRVVAQAARWFAG
jgi:starch synthase